MPAALAAILASCVVPSRATSRTPSVNRVHTLVSARGNTGGESITIQSNQAVNWAINAGSRPDCISSNGFSTGVPAGKNQSPASSRW